jgi:hypothetical protein
MRARETLCVSRLRSLLNALCGSQRCCRRVWCRQLGQTITTRQQLHGQPATAGGGHGHGHDHGHEEGAAAEPPASPSPTPSGGAARSLSRLSLLSLFLSRCSNSNSPLFSSTLQLSFSRLFHRNTHASLVSLSQKHARRHRHTLSLVGLSLAATSSTVCSVVRHGGRFRSFRWHCGRLR